MKTFKMELDKIDFVIGDVIEAGKVVSIRLLDDFMADVTCDQ